MNTHFVGIKEFRAHINEYVAKSRKKGARYVVVNRNKPLFELTPFKESETFESFVNSIREAERDVKEGRVMSHEELVKSLGLR